MHSEKKLRDEIKEKVKKIYKLRCTEKQFVPGKTRVHYAGRVFNHLEMQALVDSSLDFWLTLGPRGREFENKFAKYLGLKYSIVVNSGSSANLLAVAALCSGSTKNHLNSGDEVITTAMTFPTTLTPIILYGLKPVFVDVEEGTYNISVEEVEKAISKKTRALMFAHTLGNPCKMDDIMKIARKHNLFVIEDACDALDSKYNGQLCGTFGDISTYSFYAAHHITMGEGGAVATNDAHIYRQLLSIRDWGRACWCPTGESRPEGACGNRFGFSFGRLPRGYDHKYVYLNIGYNLKPLDLQPAMGIEQLKKIKEFTQKRNNNFQKLYKFFSRYEDKFILPRIYEKAVPSWFAFPLTIREGAGFTRNDFVGYLEKNKIETRMLFAGNILHHPGFQNISRRTPGGLKNTDVIVTNSFFLGVYPGINDDMIDYIRGIVEKYFKNFKSRVST